MLLVDEHRQYLADGARVSAFRQAIEDVVRPGDVVLDLASGTGILGLLACRAGAGRVYSVEVSGMIELAREICRANGFQDRMVFLKGLSTRVDLPEKVDVAVCDQMGRFGFEAGVVQFFADASKRFLKPGGTLIPARLDMVVCPVECQEIWSQVEYWNDSPAGFDFRPARQWAANTGYPVKLVPDQLLASPAVLTTLEMTSAPTSFRREVTLVVSRRGVLHGIGGWFSAQLSRNVTMTNSPLVAERINRHNVFFPLDRPVPVVAGDCIRIQMHIAVPDIMVTWNVEVRGQAKDQSPAEANGCKARFSHSTLRGMLLSKEDLRKTQPQFTPKLSSWGLARRSILELCDGKRPLVEIEQEVFRRHGDLFPSLGEAAGFVAEVVTRYSV